MLATVLLMACGKKDKVAKEYDGRSFFLAYQEKINESLKKDSESELSVTASNHRFRISYVGENDIYVNIDVTKNYFYINCYFTYEFNNALPDNVNLAFLAELFNEISKEKVSVEYLENYFLAKDVDYLPDDYDYVINRWYFDEKDTTAESIVISYKENGNYEGEGNYFMQQVSSNLQGKLLLCGQLSLNDKALFTNLRKIGTTLEKWQCSLWTYLYSEVLTAQIAEKTKMEIELRAGAKQDTVANLADLNFKIEFVSALNDKSEAKDPTVLPTFIALANVLAPDTLSEGQLLDFIGSENEDYIGPINEYMIERRQLRDQWGIPVWLSYIFWNDLSEVLMFSTLD